MMDIKVGDTVERVIGEYLGMRIGDTATVTSVYSRTVELKEFKGSHMACNLKVIARQEEPARPTKKTVADAWDYYKGKLPIENNPKSDCIAYSEEKEKGFVFVRESFIADYPDYYVVCTREQFEAYGREQESFINDFKKIGKAWEAKLKQEAKQEVKKDGEKWTHIDTYGIKVSFLVNEPDSDGGIPVLCDDGYYRLYDFDELKPIKPKLTESAMLSRIAEISRGTLSDAECGDKIRELFDTVEIV